MHVEIGMAKPDAADGVRCMALRSKRRRISKTDQTRMQE